MSKPYNDDSPFICSFCGNVTPDDCLKTIAYTPDGSFTQESIVCLSCAYDALKSDPERCKLVHPKVKKSSEA